MSSLWFYCHTCKKAASELEGTANERSPLPTDKVVSILDQIREGCGIRATSRLTGVARDTISRYLALAGDQSELHHDGRPAPPVRHLLRPGGSVR